MSSYLANKPKDMALTNAEKHRLETSEEAESFAVLEIKQLNPAIEKQGGTEKDHQGKNISNVKNGVGKKTFDKTINF